MTESCVTVNSSQCLAVSKTLLELEIRPGFTRRPFLSHPLKLETRLNMLFFAVAICHQTRDLKNEKRNLFGWDYIERVFLDLAVNKSKLLDIQMIDQADDESIAFGLEAAFSDDGEAIKTSLDRIGERVRLLKDLSHYIYFESDGSFSSLLEKANGFLINKGQGLYELLEKTEAFADQMRKKSSFLIKLLIDSGLFSIKDPENYIPIMDYHMQRVLLRLGCVEIQDDDLRNAITHRQPLATDQHVRKACIEAVKELAKYSGIDIWKMNDIFWSLGRSCCHESMLCLEGYCIKKPCTFQMIVLTPDHEKCSFEPVCNGAGKEETRLLWEPIVETHYY